MASKPHPLLLEGEVQTRDQQMVEVADRLTIVVDRLTDQVAAFQQRLMKVEQENAILMKLLSPLYKALRPVFGDADPVAELGSVSSDVQSRHAGVWAAWKQRLTNNAGKIIDALLTHRELSSSQIAIATGIAGGNVAKYVYELNKAGLINKAGGRISLKSL